MLNKLAERLRAVAANVSVAKPAKPDPVTRSAERATDADIVLPVMLEKPAQISNKEPPAKVSGQTPDKLPPVTHPVMRTSKALRAITCLHKWLAEQNKPRSSQRAWAFSLALAWRAAASWLLFSNYLEARDERLVR